MRRVSPSVAVRSRPAAAPGMPNCRDGQVRARRPRLRPDVMLRKGVRRRSEENDLRLRTDWREGQPGTPWDVPRCTWCCVAAHSCSVLCSRGLASALCSRRRAARLRHSTHCLRRHSSPCGRLLSRAIRWPAARLLTNANSALATGKSAACRLWRLPRILHPRTPRTPQTMRSPRRRSQANAHGCRCMQPFACLGPASWSYTLRISADMPGLLLRDAGHN